MQPLLQINKSCKNEIEILCKKYINSINREKNNINQ